MSHIIDISTSAPLVESESIEPLLGNLDKRVVEECSVCLESLDEFSNTITKCNHTFHQQCLDRWLERDNTCPNCRFVLIEKLEIALEVYEDVSGFDQIREPEAAMSSRKMDALAFLSIGVGLLVCVYLHSIFRDD